MHGNLLGSRRRWRKEGRCAGAGNARVAKLLVGIAKKAREVDCLRISSFLSCARRKTLEVQLAERIELEVWSKRPATVEGTSNSPSDKVRRSAMPVDEPPWLLAGCLGGCNAVHFKRSLLLCVQSVTFKLLVITSSKGTTRIF